MAVVFISHAHRDELLAQKLVTVLGAALDLSRADFFLSSEEGHGVAPAASILESIVGEIRQVSSLLVLLTPTAAQSPWVWLEAGSRLGHVGKSAPIFVVPSERCVHLLEPMPDSRCLQLGRDGQVLELVEAVGKSLGRPPLEVLQYKPAVDDLVQSSRKLYSATAERRARAVSWLKSHALGLVLAAAGLGMLAWTLTQRGGLAQCNRELVASRADLAKCAGNLDESSGKASIACNDAVTKTAAGFLVLKGRVTARQNAVHGAMVMVARKEIQDPKDCQEAEPRSSCVGRTTTTGGEFTIDLTRIQARRDEDLVLSVVKPGLGFFSRGIKLDVRAMDVGTAPLQVELSPATVKSKGVHGQ